MLYLQSCNNYKTIKEMQLQVQIYFCLLILHVYHNYWSVHALVCIIYKEINIIYYNFRVKYNLNNLTWQAHPSFMAKMIYLGWIYDEFSLYNLPTKINKRSQCFSIGSVHFSSKWKQGKYYCVNSQVYLTV